jgi:hypothetical protein
MSGTSAIADAAALLVNVLSSAAVLYAVNISARRVPKVAML